MRLILLSNLPIRVLTFGVDIRTVTEETKVDHPQKSPHESYGGLYMYATFK